MKMFLDFRRTLLLLPLAVVALSQTDGSAPAGGAPLAPQLSAWQTWMADGLRIMAGDAPPHAAGRELRAAGAKNSAARVSFALRSGEAIASAALEVSPLKSEGGAEISAKDIDIKLVKPWYQDANGWFSGERAPGAPIMVPELLLHDDSLVLPDAASKANIVRETGGGAMEVHPTAPGPHKDFASDDDAAALRPFAIGAGETRQLLVSIRLSKTLPAGLYKGSIAINGDGKRLGDIPVSVRVIDHVLGTAKSRFSGRLSLDGRKVPSGASPATVSTGAEPFQAVFFLPEKDISKQTLDFFRSYGLDAPALPPAKAAQATELFESMPGTLWVAPPLALVKKPAGVVDGKALQAGAKAAKASGAGRINFFVPMSAGCSGAEGEREVLEALDDLGGIAIWAHSTFATYTNFADVVSAPFEYGLPGDKPKVGEPSISPNTYGGHEETDTRLIEDWHAIGLPCYLVVTDSAAIENPAFWRRAVGLQPYYLGYDGVILPRVVDEVSPWGDRSGDFTRSRTIAYPSRTGYIPTLALAGIAEGIADVRYLSDVRSLAYAIRFPATGDAEADIEARKALHWMQTLDPRRADMDAVRLECIAWIEKLSAVLEKLGRK